MEGSARSRISPEADANLAGGSEKNGLDRGAERQLMEKTTTNPLIEGGGAQRIADNNYAG